ncbi:MAG TPA: hypothetical protein DIW64_00445 [Cellvibrio sp.]|nr:hypothetical protein [Cellvibrio sp.]
MATNKNQHFVPRVYLRRFTSRNDAQINLFNLDRRKLIRNAPVKKQCSGDYFYGQDPALEAAIQGLESGYGKAMRVLDAGIINFGAGHKTVFKLFWLFQHLRTEAAARRSMEMMEGLGDLAGADPQEFTANIKAAVRAGCVTFTDTMHQIDDLKFCLLKNKTPIPFITSDNPAVLTNKWRLDRNRSPGLSFGLGSAGMIALLPLRPDLLFVGYDGDVYHLPKRNGIAEIKNASDVTALNRHQFLQCHANIYTNDSISEENLIDVYAQIEPIRPVARHVTHYAVLASQADGYERYEVTTRDNILPGQTAMIHSQVIHPHPGAWPSQITIRANGSVYTNNTGAGYRRRSGTTGASQHQWVRERP